jgi:GNAT superfamily N-acetyltransferase
MDHVPGGEAAAIELHEARVRAACVAATARWSDNPLGATVDLTGPTRLFALTAMNFSQFNRVVALGAEQSATDDEVARVTTFFAEHHQTRFQIEVTPASQPSDLARMLANHGLVDTGTRTIKSWIDLARVRPDPGVDVTELTAADRDQWVAVNLATWEMPRLFGAWFGATLGEPGFRHFGVFDEGVLASVGAMCVDGDLAWSGFSATRPSYRARGYHQATVAHRVRAAADMGCRLFHSESAVSASGEASTSSRNHARLGVACSYLKVSYGPEPAGG